MSRHIEVLEIFVHCMLIDVRYGVRRLARAPLLTFALIVTVACGLGVNTVVFSVVNGVLLKSYAGVADPRLVAIVLTERGTHYPERMLKGEYLDHFMARRPTRVEHISGVKQFQTAASLGGESRMLMGEAVVGDYFSIRGCRPVIGRLFDGMIEGGERQAVISERLWRTAYAAAGNVVGQQISLDGDPYTIIGVLPSEFQGLVVGNIVPYDVWVPRRSAPGLSPDDRSLAYLMGRLAPGVSLDEARAEIQVIGTNLIPGRPAVGLGIQPLGSALFYGPPVLYLAGVLVLVVSGLVLLVAIANVSNLLLTSVLNRAHELAVRQMVGAGRSELTRLLAVETSLVVLGGLLLGMPLAMFSARALVHLPLPDRGGIAPILDASPDWRVFAFAFAIAFVATSMVSTVLARQASAVDSLSAASATGGGGGSTDARGRIGSRLIIVQVAIAVALLVNTAFVLRAAAVALSWDPGFNAAGAVVSRLDYRLIAKSAGRASLETCLERLRRVPGVTSVAIGTSVPGNRESMVGRLGLPGQMADQGIHGQVVAVSPGFIQSVGLHLTAGQDLPRHPAERGASVAILSKRAAAALFWGAQPLGQTIRVTHPSGSQTLAEVVGLVSDVRDPRGMAPTPFAIVPFGNLMADRLIVVVRGAVPEERLLRTMQEVVHDAIPTVPLVNATTLSQHILGETYSLRVTLIALCAVGLMGAAISLLGIYSLTSYRVSTRVRELGIRIALGATSRTMYGSVIRDTRGALATGNVAGVVAAIPIALMIRTFVPGLEPFELLPLVVPSLLFCVAGITATILPLAKLLRKDPVLALRQL